MSEKPPTNLLDAVRYFADLDVCNEFVASLRWADGPECPSCGGKEHSYLTTRRLWKCKSCQRQFSVKVGTIFEDSPIPLSKWLPAIWLIANSKNGISSHELARATNLTQKSAWFVLHRIRLAMQTGSFQKFDGEVEIDETIVGGTAANMHKTDRIRKETRPGRPGSNKSIVAGALQRGTDGPSQVLASVIPDTRRATLHAHVRSVVEPGATLNSDAHPSYTGLSDHYDHATVDHGLEYVRGRVHTNGMESFWALLKRGLSGTYVSIAPIHLFRYVDERVFTFNQRDLSDLGRFSLVLSQIAGRRLTYDALTGRA